MKYTIQRNDITKMEVDAIVLPANWKLEVGSGASLAIFEAAGKEDLEAECALQRNEAERNGLRLVPGVSIPTHAFKLPAKIVLHTIVPKWDETNSRKCYEDLVKAYVSALMLADQMGLESIAFPVLAAGNNGFDADLAIKIAIQSFEQFEPATKLALAYLVPFGSYVTQRICELGYEVDEQIDQMQVFEQNMQQAAWMNENKGGVADAREKPAFKVAIDKGIEWMKQPEHLLLVAQIGIPILEAVIPQEKAGGIVHKALDAVQQFIEH